MNLKRFALGFIFWGSQVFAREYYLNSAGNDKSEGSISSPWKTIRKLNSTKIYPGDRVFFEGGSTFIGGIDLSIHDHGDPNNPVVIESYGKGRATLKNQNGHGIFIYNSAGIKIRQLHIVGSECASSTPDPFGCASESDCRYSQGTGIYFLNDLPLTQKLSGIEITDSEIEGFGNKPDPSNPTVISGPQGNGIRFDTLPLHRELESPNKSRGFDNIKITNSTIHDNLVGGIVTIGLWPQKTYREVYIGNVKVFNHQGIPHLRTHTGSGILLSAVEGGVVENSEAFANGCLNYAIGGPVGVWAFNSSHILFQHNESHHNRTLGVDGGGFDFDGGVTDSVMQYNQSHHNDGPGYLLAQFPGAPPFNNIVIHHNTSYDDSQGNDGGGIFIWAKVHDSIFHDNTVFVRPHKNNRPAAVRFLDWSGSNVQFIRNIFQTIGGLPLLDVTSGPGLLFKGNTYSSSGGPLEIIWDDKKYFNFNDWRRDTNQEN